MTLRLELDFAYDEETLDEALFRATQKHEAITYRIEDVHGPGGGWPVIAFFAPDVEHLRAFVYDVYGSGDRVGDEEIVQSAEYVALHPAGSLGEYLHSSAAPAGVKCPDHG